MTLDLNGKKGNVGFSFAWNGLKEVVKTERNFRIHLVATLLVIILCISFDLVYLEWAVICLVIGLVLIAEMINSAIEKMLDYLNPSIHPQAKIIKDIAAGAVLLAAIIATVIGLIIFLPKIMNLLN